MSDLHERQARLLGGGQRALARARVLVVGCGGLGSGCLPALAAAGVGHLTVVDDDVVEASNLNRQVLYGVSDLGERKASRTAARLRSLAPATEVRALERRVTADDAELAAAHHVVVDCTDSAPSRAAVSAMTREGAVPLVWAAVQGWDAMVSVFPPGGPYLDDLFPDFAPDERPDVLGATALLAGAWQAAEVIKLLTGVGTPLVGRVQVVSLLTGTARTLPLAARSAS